MADYASQLLGPSADRPQEGAAGKVDYAGSLLRRGQYSESVMGRKVVPLENRASVSEVSSLPAPDIMTALKYTGARMFKGDDEEAIANVLLKALPEAELLYDRDPKLGRDVPYISYKGKAYYINRPGVSPVDAENVVGQVAAYMPAGKFAQLGKTLAGQAGRAAAGAGATSVGGDLLVDAMGGDTGVDVGKAATNVALGPMAQVIGAKLYPLLNRKSVVDAFGNLSPEASTALSKIGVDPSLLTPQGIARLEEWFKRTGGSFTADAKSATTQANAALAEQEGIRLTQGQASGDLRQIAREEAMRNYARGKGAGDTLKDFDALQAQDVQGAISRRQAELGAIGGKQQTPRLGNQYEAGAASLENVRKAERALSDQIGTKYGEAGEIGLSFKGDAIPLLRKRVDSDLAAATVDMSKETTPFTLRARAIIDDLKNSQTIETPNRPGVAGTTKSTVFEDIDLRELETVRKRLNSVYRGAKNSPEDARGVRQIIKALDGWIDDAIDSGLASGDPTAIKTLKEARALRTRYGQLFEPQTYDGDAGRVMQKIVNTDATPNEVVNLLFGYGELGQTPVSVRVAKRMRDILGDTSPEWGQYREAAFMRLIGGPQGQGGKEMIISRINRALDGQGMSLTREIFTPEEITRIKALRTAIERTVTPKSVGNPSKTGYEVARLLEDALGKVGGIAGLLKGDVTGAAATLGIKGAKNAKATVEARKVTSGVSLPPGRGFSPAVGAATAAGDEARARLWQWFSGEGESSPDQK